MTRAIRLRAPGLLAGVLALAAVAMTAAAARAAVIDFEALPDAAPLTTQVPGLTFSNAVALAAAGSLNELEFPPRSGAVVAGDDGGPIAIQFSGTVRTVGAAFTYLVPLTITAFDAGGRVLEVAGSRFRTNAVLTGQAGSRPNEVVHVRSAIPIARLTISGRPGGASFTLDDLTVDDQVANLPPLAEAGPDQDTVTGVAAWLDGGASDDPDHGPQPLRFTWRFASVPAGSGLADADILAARTPTPRFTPDVPGVYILQVRVSDGLAESLDEVTVLASPPSAPTCFGRPATIFVLDGLIVGGPDHGRRFRGTLRGTPGDDVIAGTPGADTIRSGGGNDVMCGGLGDDAIEGGPGDDMIDGGPGNDRIKVYGGRDHVRGGPGNDHVEAGPGADFVDGGSGHDSIKGGPGADVLIGGAGNDQIEGGAGDDVILGGPGNDLLEGQTGDDRVDGGSGNDRVDGGPGRDACAGRSLKGCER